MSHVPPLLPLCPSLLLWLFCISTPSFLLHMPAGACHLPTVLRAHFALQFMDHAHAPRTLLTRLFLRIKLCEKTKEED